MFPLVETHQVTHSAGLGTGGPHTPEVTESQAPSRGLGLSAQSQASPSLRLGTECPVPHLTARAECQVRPVRG